MAQKTPAQANLPAARRIDFLSQHGGGSVDGASSLSGSAFEYWNNWQETILRKIPARGESGNVPRVPYSDPALIKSPGLYAEFIAKLIRIGWSL